MKFILSGFGKMGVLIEERALSRGHKISAVIDPAAAALRTKNGAAIYKSVNEIDANILKDCDAVIDFTNPAVVFENIKTFAGKGLSIVVGTTGWYEKLPEVEEIVKKSGAALLYAANFSLGINLFYKIVSFAAALFDKYDEYDVSGLEIHHNKKADSPSGTAKVLAGNILENFKRKKTVCYDKLDRPPRGDEFHFASMRLGAVPGVHEIFFDSSADTVEIKHTARNREGLVSGVILGAEAFVRKVKEKGGGVYTLEDVL